MLTDLMGGELTVHSEPGRGSAFVVRLFLPQVHGAASQAAAPARPRGYEGERRRLLVVDNEEADRELLVQLLEPLGFELRTAASGHDALDLLVAGLAPDAILMDLAMPGIDGWETLRRARRLPGMRARIAIVSANAFDKGLDNDAGVRAEDFILKPVRHANCWTGCSARWRCAGRTGSRRRLRLRPRCPHRRPRDPIAQSLAALAQLVQLGYPRGVLNKLDEIESAQPAAAAFCQAARRLAQAFEFEAMGRQIAGGPGQEALR